MPAGRLLESFPFKAWLVVRLHVGRGKRPRKPIVRTSPRQTALATDARVLAFHSAILYDVCGITPRVATNEDGTKVNWRSNIFAATGGEFR